MKRFLAIMLCLVMLFSLAPVSAFAADPESEPEEPAAEEVVETADAAEEEQPAEEPAEEPVAAEEPAEPVAEQAEETPAAAEEPTAAEEVVSEEEELELTANLGDNEASVTIGETTTEYPTFAAAWSAVNQSDTQSTITLLKEVEQGSTNTLTASGAEVTLDLNGKAYTNTGSSTKTFYIRAGTFTVVDSKGNGSITGSTAYSGNGSVLYAYTGVNSTYGIIYLNNGTINEGTSTSTSTVYCSGKNTAVYINGGSVNGIISKATKTGTISIKGGSFNNEPQYIADGYQASKEGDNWTVSKIPVASVTVDGTTTNYGTFTEAKNKAVSADYANKTITLTLLADYECENRIALRSNLSDETTRNLILDLGEKELKSASSSGIFIINKNTTLTVKNGTINATATSETDATVPYIAQMNSGSSLNIESGTYTTAKSVGAGNGCTTSNVTIIGGTFGFDPSSYITDDYEVTKDSENDPKEWTVSRKPDVASVTTDTTTTYYTSIDKAYNYINNTLQSSKTVTVQLLRHFEVSSQLKNNYPVTFDLNGYTLTCVESNTNKRLFYASSNLTITDTSKDKDGCVDASAKEGKDGFYIAGVGSNNELTINGGYFKTGKNITTGYNFFYKASGATVTISEPATSWFNRTLEYDGLNSVELDNAPNSDYPYTYANSATIAYNLNYKTEDETLLATLPDSQADCAYIDATDGTYVVTNNLSSKQPVKAGAKFTGWNTVQTPTTDTPGTSFKSGDAINIADVSSSVASGTLTLYAQWDTTTTNVAQIGDDTEKQYKTIMEALYNVTDNTDTTIKLINNVTDETVTVASTKKVTLDLNGYYLDTTIGELKGSAISNYGELTVTDSGSGGYIKGEAKTSGGGIDNSGTLKIIGGTISGTAPNYGGAIYNSGTLTITGGTISGTATSKNGGGIYNKGTLTITGGEITGGKAVLGGGVYNNATLTVGGTAVISGNTESGGNTANNIYLPKKKYISISTETPLASGANICITANTLPAIITSNGSSTDAAYFHSDNAAYGVVFVDGDTTKESTDPLYNNHLVLVSTAVSGAEYCASLTLKDSIDINLKMYKLSSDFDLNKITVKVGNEAIEKIDVTTDSETNLKNLSCVLKSVAPHEMKDSIHVTVAYDNAQIKVFDYSVPTYCNYKITTDGETSKLGQLCVAVLNYGKWAEDYYYQSRGESHTSTVNSGHEIESFTDVPKQTATGFTASTTVESASANLLLDSQITLNFKLKYNGTTELSTSNLLINGVAITSENITVEKLTGDSDFNYKISISHLDPTKLSQTYTLTIYGVSADTFTLTYGVYHYCYSIQYIADETYTAQGTLQNLCKSIYNYGECADAYVK